jgi:metal-responsive CopG/Arc/MetJ family transcriptional regulator
METVQIVLDERLLRATDRAARRFKVNRSALVRDALRAHLAALTTRERERADRLGYEQRPDVEGRAWEKLASWPED